MKPMKQAVVLFAAALALASSAQQQDESISMHLSVDSSNNAFLNVTFNNVWKKLTFSDVSLVCHKNNEQSMEGAKRVSINRKNHKTIFKRETYLYKVNVQSEGFVQCNYKPWGKLLASSNIVFIRFGNVHVSAVKLNGTISVQSLQRILSNTNFTVRQIAPDKDVFHFDSKKYIARNPNDDFIIIQQLQKLLVEKLRNEASRVVYVRSTKFCPTLEQHKIPFVKYGDTFKFDSKSGVKCNGNFYTGAYWNEADLQTIKDAIENKKEIMRQSQNLTFTSEDQLKDLSDLLDNIGTLGKEELDVIANNFDRLVEDKKRLLQGAEAKKLNEILMKLDSVLAEATLTEEGFLEKVRENFAARVEDCKVTGNIGVFLTEKKQEFSLILAGSNNDKVVASDTSVGFRLPTTVLNDLGAQPRLAVSVFKEAKSLFRSEHKTSSVVSATLGGAHTTKLEEPVVIWFRRNASTNPKPGLCVYWNFKRARGKGAWTQKGCTFNFSHPLGEDIFLDECHCLHMTHFALLLWNSERPFPETDAYELQIVSLVGSIVSLVALSAVVLTALLQRKWLNGAGQKILLQMSINQALLLIAFLVASLSTPTAGTAGCFAVGFFLHYTILSNFFFMSVAGYLQYHRLVKVIYTRTTKLTLKAAVVGWGLPVVPGALVLLSQQFQFYSEPPLCLPTHWAFHATILLPLCIILVINIAILSMIGKNLYQMVELRRNADHCLSIRRFKQLLFLFTLLGLNWIFGVCQVISEDMELFFAYIFSFLIAFQGLAYFVFFVLLHEHARNWWKMLLCGGESLFNLEWTSSKETENTQESTT